MTVNTKGSSWTISGGNSITFVSATYPIQLGKDDRGQEVLNVSVDFNSVLTDISAAVSDTQVQGDPTNPCLRCGRRYAGALPGGVSRRRRGPGVCGPWAWLARGAVRPELDSIGSNPLSQWLGFQQVSPYQGVNLVLESAGGTFQRAR